MAFLDSRPSPFKLRSIWLELTRKCNLTCSHCYADSHPGHDLLGSMTAGDWRRVIDEAVELGCSSVQFIGGEPLLHPHVADLARQSHSLGMHVEILTNGTVLTEKMLQWMAETQADVSTSVYSCSPEPHDEVTGKAGSWRRTLNNIDRMRAVGLRVRAGIIYRDWTRDRVEQTTSLLESKGVLVGTDVVRSIGRGGSTNTHDGYLRELCGACGLGRVCVTNDGDAFPCIIRQTPLSNLREQSLQSALRSAAMANFLADMARVSGASAACTPDCWPHGGCAPHDLCNPHKHEQADRSVQRTAACTPDCWPHGGCAPHDVCNPQKRIGLETRVAH